VKRIAAILLLVLLLFNWVGYEFYTAILQDHADKTMVANLDQNKYTDADLISIKVPATHLSSYVNSKEFQRIDGKIEIEGVLYNYVKRRFSEDSLELLCIPNKTATSIQTARNEFFKLVNDLQHPGQSKKSDQHSSSFKGFSAEYFSNSQSFAISNMMLIRQKATDHYLLQIPSVYLTRAGQPPDFA
jgi:PBP1b-binding outer membrane lipoprotein LpoB